MMVSMQIIETMNAQFSVKSEGRNGTTFSIRLPIAFNKQALRI
ncbi:sensor histidine kinase [Halalkalibacter wakoensis]|nr:sensor histidine kinase [Halalkalibacter wakoensis]